MCDVRDSDVLDRPPTATCFDRDGRPAGLEPDVLEDFPITERDVALASNYLIVASITGGVRRCSCDFRWLLDEILARRLVGVRGCRGECDGRGYRNENEGDTLRVTFSLRRVMRCSQWCNQYKCCRNKYAGGEENPPHGGPDSVGIARGNGGLRTLCCLRSRYCRLCVSLGGRSNDDLRNSLTRRSSNGRNWRPVGSSGGSTMRVSTHRNAIDPGPDGPYRPYYRAIPRRQDDRDTGMLDSSDRTKLSNPKNGLPFIGGRSSANTTGRRP